MNLVVYVADALRTDHVGCYGARRVRTPTIDELAAGGVRFDQAISAAPWTCPSTTSMITGLYPASPRLPALGRRARSRPADAVHGRGRVRLRDGQLRLRRELPLPRLRGRERRGHERDGSTASSSGCATRGSEPFCLWFHSWTTHMPYDVLHSERKEWRAAKEDDHHGHPVRRPCRARRAARELPRGGRARVRDVLRRLPRRRSTTSGCASETALAFVADHGESWGERYDDKSAGEGHVPHARRRRSTTRSSGCR